MRSDDASAAHECLGLQYELRMAFSETNTSYFFQIGQMKSNESVILYVLMNGSTVKQQFAVIQRPCELCGLSGAVEL